jgi:predicted nucleic acid-binding protein
MHYVDTSALVKLVIEEAETSALFDWLGEQEQPVVTSDLARTELLRAVRRGAPGRAAAARVVLRALGTVAVSTDICERAGLVEPTSVRSLDAIHLATALTLGDDLETFVCYDTRLLEAAALNGLPTASPR